MSRAVAISGLGIAAAPGIGIDAQLSALHQGSCGLAPRSDPRLPLASELALGHVDGALTAHRARTTSLALSAAEEALAQLAPHHRAELGVIVGTSTGGMPESEAAYFSDPTTPHAAYRDQQAHQVAAAVARHCHCRGPQNTHSVACASAASAIAEGAEWIRQGLCPRVLVIGADALCRLTIAGFTSLKVVDPAGCRPLVEERAGMSLGEAGAALLLESPEALHARGGEALACLRGWGLRADAYHATAPEPSGAQLERAIRDALADAALSAGAIDYVNAHGTGTRDNDSVECAALGRVFGQVPTASSKRSYGHTMGAAAAVEAVACCLALREQQLWASAGAEAGTALGDVEVVRATRAAACTHALSTSLAFGGVNAALIFGRAEQCA